MSHQSDLRSIRSDVVRAEWTTRCEESRGETKPVRIAQYWRIKTLGTMDECIVTKGLQEVVGGTGFEPVTSAMSTQRSRPLS